MVSVTRRPRSRLELITATATLLCIVPPAVANAAVSNRELVEVTDVDSLSVSPDGRFVVFRTVRADVGRNSHVLRWHSVDLEDGTVRDIGSGGDPIYLDPGSIQPESPVWPADGQSIIARALIDGAVGLWRVDLKGAGMAALVVPDSDVEDYSATADGRALVYKVGPSREEIRRAESQEYDSGILVDSSVDLAQNLFRGGSINGRMSTQRLVGYWYVRNGLLWRAPRQQRRFDLLTGADAAVGPPEPVPPFEAPASRPPSQSRSARGDLAEAVWDGRKGMVSVTIGNGQKLSCPDPICSSTRVAALVWRPGSADLVITFIDRERRQSLYFWSTQANSLREIAAADGLLSGGRRHMFPCVISAAAAFCVAASPASPPSVERIDLASGERRVLFDPNPGLRSLYRPTVRYLRWDIGRGRDAAGVLMQMARPTDGPAPLYINYYSCEGFLRGGEGDEWPISELLQAGFAIACINQVPSTGRQDAVDYYRTGLEAVRALIDRLSGEGIVDRSKVAMGGLSFGSEVALWTAVNSKALAALSIASGQSEPTKFWMDSLPGSDRARLTQEAWGLGRPEETPSRWKLVSPALNAGKIDVPILFQLPEQEARMIPELYARLDLAAVPTELYAFPDESHLKLQPRHRLAVYERNLDWFRYWLQDYRDPDRAKAEQYRRWDALKARWRSAVKSTAP